jgi:hypothetical protein
MCEAVSRIVEYHVSMRLTYLLLTALKGVFVSGRDFRSTFVFGRSFAWFRLVWPASASPAPAPRTAPVPLVYLEAICSARHHVTDIGFVMAHLNT